MVSSPLSVFILKLEEKKLLDKKNLISEMCADKSV